MYINLDKTIGKILSAASKIVEEVHVKVEGGELVLYGMDPSHVAMVSIRIPASTDLQESIQEGTVTSLDKWVYGAKTGAVVGIQGSKLILQLEDMKYETPLSIASAENLAAPNLDLYEAQIDFAKLKPALDLVKADTVTFTGNGLAVKAVVSGELDSAEVMLGQTSAEFRVHFSTAYIQPLIQLGEVKAYFKTNMPLKIEAMEGKAVFWVAPKILDEEEAPPAAAETEAAAAEAEANMDEDEEIVEEEAGPVPQN